MVWKISQDFFKQYFFSIIGLIKFVSKFQLVGIQRGSLISIPRALHPIFMRNINSKSLSVIKASYTSGSIKFAMQLYSKLNDKATKLKNFAFSYLHHRGSGWSWTCDGCLGVSDWSSSWFRFMERLNQNEILEVSLVEQSYPIWTRCLTFSILSSN